MGRQVYDAFKELSMSEKVWLVSYPRSGNTWTRFLLANIQHPGKEIGYRNLEALVPDTYQSSWWREEKVAWSPLILKSHDLYRPEFEGHKVIYLYRDGRDVARSCYYYYQRGIITEQWRVRGSFSDYLKLFVQGWNLYGDWKAHLQFWLFSQRGSQVFSIRYEDLLADTVGNLKKLMRFLNIEVSDDIIVSAVQKSSFKKLQAIREQEGLHPYLQGLKGTSGGWKEIFTEDDLELFWQYAGDLMEKLGYRRKE